MVIDKEKIREEVKIMLSFMVGFHNRIWLAEQLDVLPLQITRWKNGYNVPNRKDLIEIYKLYQKELSKFQKRESEK